MEYFAIKVSNLSKTYMIGSNEYFGSPFINTFTKNIKQTFKNIKHTIKKEETIFYALKSISFEVKKGEILGIIGQNGAGKTTLLKILSGITEPSEGRIEMIGRAASILEVGSGFHPELTGRENVYLSGKMLGLKKKEIKARFDEILAFSDVEKFIDTPVKHYSSGMYIRLAFSVVAHVDADILLFDEVMNMGDSEFQNKSARKITELIGTDKTVIVVSHNMNEIIKLCNRVICLEQGCIVEQGEPGFAVRRYLSKINEKLTQQVKHSLTEDELKAFNSKSAPVYRLDFAGITQDGREVNSSIPINQKFEFRFKLEKFKEEGSLIINLVFFNMGIAFLSTNTIYPKDGQLEIDKMGIYEFQVLIPERFFNASVFEADIYITDNLNFDTKKLKSALRFVIIPDKTEMDGGLYNAHCYFHGPMYTSLSWTINKKENEY